MSVIKQEFMDKEFLPYMKERHFEDLIGQWRAVSNYKLNTAAFDMLRLEDVLL
jgi:hypothetical protein